MKSIIILTMLLSFVSISFGQITQNKYWKGTDYYKESKKYKNYGWTLTGIGSAGLFLTYELDDNGFEDNYFLYKSYLISGVCLIGGINSIFVSFKKKKKAKAASDSINRLLQMEFKYIYSQQK